MSAIFAYLEDAPPRCLSAFDAIPAGQEGDEYAAAATFAIRCKSCGNDTFRPRGITRIIADGGNHVHIGVRTTCAKCARDETLINATRSGYDGELGRLGHLAGEDQEERLDNAGSEPLMLNVQFVYSIELPELLEHARDRGIGPEDFFDHVTVLCRSGDRPWREIWDFACA
ncbi:MAG TPA: hypothetical protein VHL34_08490 [Rhizomicrobium sp.]|jgi:hypothetical protein|nr:hypothetical protein [Rhizomicrobium sp.]